MPILGFDQYSVHVKKDGLDFYRHVFSFVSFVLTLSALLLLEEPAGCKGMIGTQNEFS